VFDEDAVVYLIWYFSLAFCHYVHYNFSLSI
jgi:hypothetical protein